MTTDTATMQGAHAAGSRIDVLIPAYNAAATIASSIDSIRAQTIDDLRIIVVDDGSSDDTPRILADIAAAEPRLRVLTIAHAGIVDALNTGLAHCTAEFIARHDADDIAFPERFAVQLAYLDAHPDCVAVSSFARSVDKDGRPNGGLATSLPQSFDATWVPCKEPYLLHPFMMVRRSAMLAVGGYRYVHHAEDADLCWRLQELGRLHAIPKALGDYRLHAQSVTGLSTLNGRLSAIFSQLAAISALRRRGNVDDLTFTKATIELMIASLTPAGMLAIGKRGLNGAESAYLEAGFAAKYLELASYRSYDIELDDCRFIRTVLATAVPRLPVANRRSLRRSRAIMCSRLLSKGRLHAALVLLSLDSLPQTALRFGVHVVSRCLPTRVRVALWDWKARSWAARIQTARTQ